MTSMANDNNNIQITDESQIVLYQPNESISLQVKIDASHDTVWLTQQQIADLFGTKRPAITKHLRNIFNSGELEQNSVSSILEHTAADGKTYKTQFYNLDAIISVGYRVNSINATAFRRWATRVLNNYLLKGYSVNQELLAMQRQFDSRLEEHSLRMTRIEDKQAEQQEQPLLHVGICPWHPGSAESAFPEVVPYQQGDVGLDADCRLWCLLSDGAVCRMDYPEVGL